jgi:hypothetical protein
MTQAPSRKKCEECGTTYPSEYWFSTPTICKVCYKRLSPERPRELGEQLQTEMTPERSPRESSSGASSFWQRWIANPPKLIAYSLIWGTATGTWALVQSLFNDSVLQRSAVTLALIVVFLSYYTVCGVAGVLLVRGSRRSRVPVVLALTPQLLQLQGPGILYQLACGVYATIFVVRPGTTVEFGLDFGFTSTLSIQLGDVGFPLGIAVNIVAAAMLWYVCTTPLEAVRGLPERGGAGRA